MPKQIDAYYVTDRRIGMIWADRAAVVLCLLATILAAAYAYGGLFDGMNTNLVFREGLAFLGGCILFLWVAGRALDFLVTGQIRY